MMHGNAPFCIKIAMTKAKRKIANQPEKMILKCTHFVIKQCLKGKSDACSRSKGIKERLTWEAIEKVSLIAQTMHPGHVKPLFSSSFWYMYDI